MIKTIGEIIQNRYVIPLYQRNFAWKDQEIRQLVLDLFQSMSQKRDAYFIGSLVVMKRQSDARPLMEVIDGQQRLTVMSIILKYLAPDDERLDTPFLSYDSRTEVNNFLEEFHKQKGDISPDDKWISEQTDVAVRDFCNSIDYINSSPIDSTGKSILGGVLDKDGKRAFADYILNHVMMVLVEMPKNTDVASYFEIMNNRGSQLQKHEVLKSLMMGKIEREIENTKESAKLRSVFSKLWDACSDMDHMVQRNIKPHEIQQQIFGQNFDEILWDKLDILGSDSSDVRQGYSIEAILNPNTKIATDSEIEEEEESQELGGQKAIIDFPNFLLHVFRVKYNDIYKERKIRAAQLVSVTEEDEEKYSVPLHEKELLNVYNTIQDLIEPNTFIKQLLYYRVIFDRYIVKTVDVASNDLSSDEEASDDDVKWTLHRPEKRITRKTRYEYAGFKDTFSDSDIQSKVIKALSMLQVTFRQRRYKNYLTKILSWFTDDEIDKNGTWYLNKLNRLILDEFAKDAQYQPLISGVPFDHESSLSLGTKTHHFLFNFIDYLYWTAWKGQRNIEFPELKYIKADFTFKYFNSVEHHLPQSLAKSEDPVDSLGNLCLISKSMNSRLGSETPTGKAMIPVKHGKYYKEDLPPTRKIIYDITNEEKDWSLKQIKEHYNQLVNLINARASILGIGNVDPNDVDVLRAMLCKYDIWYDSSWSKEGDRYTIRIDKNDHELQSGLLSLQSWMKDHPLCDIDDYIENELENNTKIKESPWRYFLIKYPGALRYCENRRVAFRDDDYWVTLIQKQKIVYQYRELMTYAVTQELKTKGIQANEMICDIHNKLRDRGEIDVLGFSLFFYHRCEDRSWKYYLKVKNGTSYEEIERIKRDGWSSVPSIGYILDNNQYLLKTDKETPIEEVQMVAEIIQNLYLRIRTVSKNNGI